MSVEDIKSRLGKLRDSVSSASKSANITFFSFLSVCSYVCLIAISTSHEDLVLESKIKLPLIDVSLSLSSFYIFSPIIVVLFHVCLVMQLIDAYNRSILYHQEVERLPYGDQGFYFALLENGFIGRTYAFGSQKIAFRFVSLFLILKLFCLLPISTLAILQNKYLPSHDTATTWIQRFCIFADCIVVYIIALRLFTIYLRKLLIPGLLASHAIIIVATTYSLIIATIPDEYIERTFVKLLPDRFIIKLATTPGFSFINRAIYMPSPKDRNIFYLTYYIFEAPSTLFGLKRNIYLPDKKFVTQKPTEEQISKLGLVAAWNEYGKGIDLSNRDFRYADFSRSDFRKSNLSGANFRGSNLERATLSFSVVDWQAGAGVSECSGKIDRGSCATDFTAANMVHMRAMYAKFSGSFFTLGSLRNSAFIGSNITSAKFQVADLSEVDLTGAELFLTDMRGANFLSSLFYGASIQSSDARAANFNLAAFSGTNITYTRIDGAIQPWLFYRGGQPINTAYILSMIEDIGTKQKVKLALDTNEDVRDRFPVRVKDPEGMVNIACADGYGDIFIMLGLLPRIQRGIEDYRSTISLFESTVDADDHEKNPWYKLKIKLSDPKLCGESAETFVKYSAR